MPASSSRSTVSSCTCPARSIAGSGSLSRKRLLVLSAGATTMTSASEASWSPTALRSASAETGSDTSARIFFAMRALYPRSTLGTLTLALAARQRATREPDPEHHLDRREAELEHALVESVGQRRAADRARQGEQPDQQALARAQVAVAALAQGADDGDRDHREQRRRLGVELRL